MCLEEAKRLCILVIIGAGEDGREEFVDILDGYRESAQVLEGAILYLGAVD